MKESLEMWFLFSRFLTRQEGLLQASSPVSKGRGRELLHLKFDQWMDFRWAGRGNQSPHVNDHKAMTWDITRRIVTEYSLTSLHETSTRKWGKQNEHECFPPYTPHDSYCLSLCVSCWWNAWVTVTREHQSDDSQGDRERESIFPDEENRSSTRDKDLESERWEKEQMFRTEREKLKLEQGSNRTTRRLINQAAKE